MQKLLLVAVLAICINVVWTHDASAQKYTKSISANPIGLAFNILNATYENKLSGDNSFTIFGVFWSLADWNAYGVGGSYRWYLNINDGKNPLEGLSVGPFAEFGFWSWNGPSYITNDGGASVAVGGEIAYKWVFGGFVVEPIARLALPISKISGATYTSFGAGVNLGFAW